MNKTDMGSIRLEVWCGCGARQFCDLEDDGTICQRCDTCDGIIIEGTYTLELFLTPVEDE